MARVRVAAGAWSRGVVEMCSPIELGVCVAAIESTQVRRHAHGVMVYVGRALDEPWIYPLLS